MSLLKSVYNYSLLQKSYFVFFALLPFIYTEATVDPVLIPRQAFLTIFLAFTWAVLFGKKKFIQVYFYTTKLSLLIILLSTIIALLSIISTLYSNTISESLYVSSKYGIILLFLFTTWFLLRAQLLLPNDLVNCVVIFCTISIFYGLLDIGTMVQNEINILNNPLLITATHANKNLFASILLLSLWAILYKTLKPLYKYSLLMLLIIIVVLLQSKIVLIALVIIFLGLFIFNLKSFFATRTSKKIAFVTFLLLLLVLFLFNFTRFQNLSDLHSLNTRHSLWENSWKMLIEYPLGVGAGNWQIIFPKYGLSHFDLASVKNGITQYQRPHNDFMWMFCELGIVGGLLYVSIFLTLITMTISSIRNACDLSQILLLTIIGYCFVAFFDFPLERIEHQVLLSVVIALSINSYDSRHATRVVMHSTKYLLIYFTVVVFSLIVSTYRLKGEYYTNEFIFLDKARYADLVIEKCNKSKSVFYTIDPMSIPISWYAGISLYSQGKIAKAKAALESARTLTPYNIHILKNLAILYEKEGNKLKADECQQLVTRISSSAVFETIK